VARSRAHQVNHGLALDQPDGGAVVDIAIAAITVWQGQLSVVLERRITENASQPWQLLHRPLEAHGDADATALDLLAIAKDADTSSVIEQLRTYAGIRNSGAMAGERFVTIAYFALIEELADRLRLSDAIRVFAVDDVLAEPDQFGDIEVLIDAVERVRSKLEYTTIATRLLPEPFTIPELRRVYEAVWGVALHPANFRRKVLATDGFVRPVTEEAQQKGPDLFGRGVAALLHPAMLRPD
jgi:8-oxo-dGTP diphosphatase